MHSSKYMATLLAGILAAIFSIGAIDSFGQTDLTTTTTVPAIELADEPFARAYYRVVSQNMINETHSQFTFEGNTTIALPNSTETISTIDRGQGIVTFLPGGNAIHGQLHMTTEDGTENVIVDFSDYLPHKTSIGIGLEYFSTNSTGMLAFLNNTIAVSLDETYPKGDTILTYFEWEGKAGNNVGAASTPIMQGESPINTTVTTGTSEPSTTVRQ
jgi:hypothetical protein